MLKFELKDRSVVTESLKVRQTPATVGAGFLLAAVPTPCTLVPTLYNFLKYDMKFDR